MQTGNEEDQVPAFGPGTILILSVVLAGGGAVCAYGVWRAVSSLPGGGTLVAAGTVTLVVGVLAAIGVKTTRVSRVRKRYYKMDALVGRQAIVKERIPKGGKGVVILDNELWSATSEAELEKDSRVTIINIRDLLLYVKESG